MRRIAIIPARGGSKRIPRKNIRLFAGVPIVWHPIAVALRSKCFDTVMVSTDDAEIAAVAKEAGASVPFLRSAQNSDDHATTAAVLDEVLARYGSDAIEFDQACCIYPVAALITCERLQQGLHLLTTTPGCTSVATVLRFSYPVERAVRIVNDRLQMLHPQHLNTRSQDLPDTYHDAGQFYWFYPEALRKHMTLVGPDSVPLVLSDLEAQDIDNEDDWRLAEAKFSLLHARA